MIVVRVVEPEDCNVANVREFRPFVDAGEAMVFDAFWWDQLSADQQQAIELALRGRKEIRVQDDFKRQDKGKAVTEDTLRVYSAYVDSFDAQHYIHAIDPFHAIVVPLTDQDKDILHRITTARLLLDKELDKRDLEELDPLMRKLKSIDQGSYFLKMSSCSAKRDGCIRPIRSARDAVDYLTESKSFLSQEYSKKKNSCVILVPFNPRIIEEPKWEFRVFVTNKVDIVGVTQQKWYKTFSYTERECRAMCEALENFKIILQSLPYNSCVLDVYFDRGAFRLLEINPTYTSGTGLFPKKYFPKFLYGTTWDDREPEFRIRDSPFCFGCKKT